MSVDAFKKLAKSAGFDLYDVAPRKNKPSGFLYHARSGRTFAFRRATKRPRAMPDHADEIVAVDRGDELDLYLAGRPPLTSKIPPLDARDESTRLHAWLLGLAADPAEAPGPPHPDDLNALMRLAGSIRLPVTDAGARHDEYIAESIYEKKMRKP